MTDRPLEPDEPEEPTEVSEPTEVVEPEEPTEVSEPTEISEPTEVTEAEEPTEVVEPEEPGPEEHPTAAQPAPDETTREQAVPPDDTTAVAPPARKERRLRRSREDRVIAGVCGGLGRYFGIDPVLVRIAALLLIFAGGVGIVLYIIGWLALPDDYAEGEEPEQELADDDLERRRGAALLGLLFVAVGIFFLLDEVWPDLSWRYIWPVALIAVGFAIVLRGRR